MAFVVNYPPVDLGVTIPIPYTPPNPPPDIPGDVAGGLERLRLFFSSYGTTSAAVAAAIGVPAELFDRIGADRQPLPLDLAAEVAAVLDAELSEVVSIVSRVTPLRGPVHRRPVPARPALGDLVPAVIYQPTQPVGT